MDDEQMTIEEIYGGVAAPRFTWRGMGGLGWSERVDPHPTYEPPPRHKRGDPDEPGWLELWWATVSAGGRDR